MQKLVRHRKHNQQICVVDTSEDEMGRDKRRNRHVHRKGEKPRNIQHDSFGR